jgi:hypothetical protein
VGSKIKGILVTKIMEKSWAVMMRMQARLSVTAEASLAIARRMTEQEMNFGENDNLSLK